MALRLSKPLDFQAEIAVAAVMTCGKQRASARTARLACDRILKFFSSNFQNSCYHGRTLFDKAAPQKSAPVDAVVDRRSRRDRRLQRRRSPNGRVRRRRLQMSPSLISEQNGWNLEMFGATRQFWPKLRGSRRNINSLHVFVSRLARPLPCNPLKTLKTTKNILGPAWKGLEFARIPLFEETPGIGGAAH